MEGRQSLCVAVEEEDEEEGHDDVTCSEIVSFNYHSDIVVSFVESLP